MDGGAMDNPSTANPEKPLEPVLFARIGWMKYYNGPMTGDERQEGAASITRQAWGTRRSISMKLVVSYLDTFSHKCKRPKSNWNESCPARMEMCSIVCSSYSLRLTQSKGVNASLVGIGMPLFTE